MADRTQRGLQVKSVAPNIRPRLGLMDLPIEVRHEIYHYLFCHQGSPVSIATTYMGLRGMEPSEPTFHTQLFRVSKEIYLDAIQFAYSANDFILLDSFPAFCGLGTPALGAIKDLTIIHASWTATHAREDSAYTIIRNSCHDLEKLELDLHSDIVLESVRYLGDFFGSLKEGEPRPSVLLDLYVWERHFSFVETSDRDYGRSLSLLNGSHQKSPSTPKFMHPKDRIMRLPPSAGLIVVSADVNSGAIEALDAFLNSSNIPLSKQAQILPETGRRSRGRSARYCYIWGKANMLEGTSRQPIMLDWRRRHVKPRASHMVRAWPL